jgi:hypothetical protein
MLELVVTLAVLIDDLAGGTPAEPLGEADVGLPVRGRGARIEDEVLADCRLRHLKI